MVSVCMHSGCEAHQSSQQPIRETNRKEHACDWGSREGQSRGTQHQFANGFHAHYYL